MQPRPFLIQVLAIVAAALILAVALHFALGARWFSFYGAAAVTLVAVPILGRLLLRRFRTLALKRWPVYAILIPIALAAIVQIGFWVAFFESGPIGVMLAGGRSMVLPVIEPYLPAAAAIMAMFTAWLVARGAMKRES